MLELQYLNLYDRIPITENMHLRKVYARIFATLNLLFDRINEPNAMAITNKAHMASRRTASQRDVVRNKNQASKEKAMSLIQCEKTILKSKCLTIVKVCLTFQFFFTLVTEDALYLTDGFMIK